MESDFSAVRVNFLFSFYVYFAINIQTYSNLCYSLEYNIRIRFLVQLTALVDSMCDIVCVHVCARVRVYSEFVVYVGAHEC